MENRNNVKKILTYLNKNKTRALNIEGDRGIGKSFLIKKIFQDPDYVINKDLIGLYDEVKNKYSGYKIINAYNLDSKIDLKKEFSENFYLMGTNIRISDYMNILKYSLDKTIPEDFVKLKSNIEKVNKKAEELFSKFTFLKKPIFKLVDGGLNFIIKSKTGADIKINLEQDMIEPTIELLKKRIFNSYYDDILNDKVLIIDEIDRIPISNKRDSDIRLIDILNTVIDLQENNENLKIILITTKDIKKEENSILEDWNEKIFSYNIEINDNNLYHKHSDLNLSLFNQYNISLSNRRVYEKFEEFMEEINNYLHHGVYTSDFFIVLSELKEDILLNLLRFYGYSYLGNKKNKNLNSYNPFNQPTEEYVVNFLNLDNKLFLIKIKELFNTNNYKNADLSFYCDKLHNDFYHTNQTRKNSELFNFIFDNILNKHYDIMPLFYYKSPTPIRAKTILYYLEYLLEKNAINKKNASKINNLLNKKLKYINGINKNKDIIKEIKYLDDFEKIFISLFNKYKNQQHKEIKVIQDKIKKLQSKISFDFTSDNNLDNILKLESNEIEYIFNFYPSHFFIEFFKQIQNNSNLLISKLRDFKNFNDFSTHFQNFLKNDRDIVNYKVDLKYNEVKDYFNKLRIN